MWARDSALIIAEAGVNHNGDLARAIELVRAAADAGADVAKFQTFNSTELVTPSAPKAAYQVRTTADGDAAQLEMLRALELDREAHVRLMRECRDAKVAFLSTPYDAGSADLLDALEVEAYKIASTDTTNLPFLRYVASKGRPMLVSTGMCSLGEVEAAVRAIEGEGLKDLALLHCTAAYPAPVEQSNLRAIHTLAVAFGYPVGFSDHTPGVTAATWAVALGACMIEKHFTLDRALPGPDHQASLVPAEFRSMVDLIRQVERAVGDGVKRVVAAETANRDRMRRSLVFRRPMEVGETVQDADLAAKRPGTGLPPDLWGRFVGRRVARRHGKDEPVTFGSVVWD